jgi:hypothetical protein
VNELEWSWFCLPYAACALVLCAVGLVAALVRGDQVLRLGTIGSAFTALPWAICSALATCTDDPEVATSLLRLGSGPIALIGPNLLIVLLGATGQLERNRWLARLAAGFGLLLLALCWGTDWVVPGVHPLSSGVLYINAGPLTGLHLSQLGIWLAVGLVMARRVSSAAGRRPMVRLLIAVLAFSTIGATDLLLVYDVAGYFPIAWLPALIAACVALYLAWKTDLLRPQGFDRGAFIELLAIAIAIVLIAIVVLALGTASLLAYAGIGTVIWVVALGVAWAATRDRPVPIARERALEEFLATIADAEDEEALGERLAALWQEIDVAVLRLIRVDLAPLDPAVATWLVVHGEAVARTDLGTMRLGVLRPKLEALVANASLIVPLVDRGTLVGIVEAEHERALREAERGLVVESARAAARTLAYLALARGAAAERETAREVEVAQAMRLQASASRDDFLGDWAVTAEYRTATRSTGAGWSANLLADGRLAVLVTEAQAHGVPAALATAALTGAFAAATTTTKKLQLDDLLVSLRASAATVVRGGEPVAAFLAILDATTSSISWACAGHPGASLLGPTPIDWATGSVSQASGFMKGIPTLGAPEDASARLGASLDVAQRGESKLPPGGMVIIASTELRGADEASWQAALRLHASAGPRLAKTLVEAKLEAGAPQEDLLAVVVRQRPDRRSTPAI